jgi:hypothetical protein
MTRPEHRRARTGVIRRVTSLICLLLICDGAPVHGPNRTCWGPGSIACQTPARPSHIAAFPRIASRTADSRQERDVTP